MENKKSRNVYTKRYAISKKIYTKQLFHDLVILVALTILYELTSYKNKWYESTKENLDTSTA
jgi:hypothetical protein